MRNRKQYSYLELQLHWRHRQELKAIVAKGGASARTIRRANILLGVDNGLTASELAKSLSCTEPTVRNVVGRYKEYGLERALFDDPRPGQKPSLNESQSQKIVAMVCGPPPKGFVRWTLRLLAEEAARRGIARVSIAPIRILLKRHDLKPWREKNVVRT